jgi:hypothetical protein
LGTMISIPSIEDDPRAVSWFGRASSSLDASDLHRVCAHRAEPYLPRDVTARHETRSGFLARAALEALAHA